jgi:hypothetical protein
MNRCQPRHSTPSAHHQAQPRSLRRSAARCAASRCKWLRWCHTTARRTCRRLPGCHHPRAAHVAWPGCPGLGQCGFDMCRRAAAQVALQPGPFRLCRPGARSSAQASATWNITSAGRTVGSGRRRSPEPGCHGPRAADNGRYRSALPPCGQRAASATFPVRRYCGPAGGSARPGRCGGTREPGSKPGPRHGHAVREGVDHIARAVTVERLRCATALCPAVRRSTAGRRSGRRECPAGCTPRARRRGWERIPLPQGRPGHGRRR